MPRKVFTPKTPRELDHGEYVREVSGVSVAVWRSLNPQATDRERLRLIANAVQDAEDLYRVLANRGHNP